MQQDYIEKTRSFVVENFLFGDSDGLSESTSLMEAGIIDSTGILELVGFLENSYKIKIEDGEIVPENMDSLLAISSFISAKLAGQVPEYEL